MAPSAFSPEFMDAIAQNVREGIRFRGIAFESERPTIVRQGGVDLQDEPVHWTLPDGRCECWSVRRMAEATDDLLAPQDSEEAYRAVAREIGYDVLGIADESALEPFRLAPGTLVAEEPIPDGAGPFQADQWALVSWAVPALGSKSAVPWKLPVV